VLSRADSLAIRDAVNMRLEDQRLADGVRTQQILDSVRIEMSRAFDSVTKQIAELRARPGPSGNPAPGDRSAQITRTQQQPRPEPVLATPQPGERRVAVLPFSPANRDGPSGGPGSRNQPRGYGNSLADSLRRALAGRGGFAIVPESTTRTVYAQANRVPTMTALMLRAPVIVTGEYTQHGRDSLRVSVQIECFGCRRNVHSATVRDSRPSAAVSILIDSLVADLAKVQQWSWPTRSGGRGPQDGRRGGPAEFQRNGPRPPPAPPGTPPPPTG
jgi:hypothetical protein